MAQTPNLMWQEAVTAHRAYDLIQKACRVEPALTHIHVDWLIDMFDNLHLNISGWLGKTHPEPSEPPPWYLEGKEAEGRLRRGGV